MDLDTTQLCCDTYYQDTLNLVCAIYKKCLLMENLSLEFPLTWDHLVEFKRLLRVKVLLLSTPDNDIKDVESQLLNGKNIIRFIRPFILKKIKLYPFKELKANLELPFSELVVSKY